MPKKLHTPKSSRVFILIEQIDAYTGPHLKVPEPKGVFVKQKVVGTLLEKEKAAHSLMLLAIKSANTYCRSACEKSFTTLCKASETPHNIKKILKKHLNKGQIKVVVRLINDYKIFHRLLYLMVESRKPILKGMDAIEIYPGWKIVQGYTGESYA